MVSECLFCKNLKKLRKDGFCSTSCFNSATKETPISGYRKCLYCEEFFPYKESAKVRSSYCKRLGIFVGGNNQKFCSRPCSLSYRNKFDNPAKRDDVRIANSVRMKLVGCVQLQTPEARLKQRNSIKGNGHWNWQGGKTKESTILRNRIETRNWRESVFKRDNYTCQNCGERNHKGNGKTVTLNADHIKPWSLFPELRWVLSNGRTLCLLCHKKTDTYMGRIKNYAHD
jgi:uncharacterized protein YlzI (FlbEa/FlbD family)